MSRGRDNTAEAPFQSIVSVLIGAVCALIICVLILLAASVGISMGFCGEEGSYRITLGACLLSNLVGGLAAQLRSRGFYLGIGASAVFCLLLLTVGVCLLDAKPFESGGLGLMAAALLGGVLSALLMRRKRKGGTRRRNTSRK